MKKFLLSLLMLLVSAVPSFSAISRTGTGNGTTSFTFSATNTNDIKIIFAFRSGSTTAPTLPAGWTTVSTGTTAAGGTVASYRVGCNVSSSSGDTGSGTWTNATNVVGVSYAGTPVHSTTDCNASGIGANATSNAKTSTTASFPTITLTDSSSWVVGFLGDSASSVCVPTGLTSFSTTATVDGEDTNGNVSSWSAATCTVSSSTWMTVSLELLNPPGTPNIIYTRSTSSTGQQNTPNTGNNHAVNNNGTYTIYLDQAIHNGNFGAACFEYGSTNTTVSVSDDKSGTWTVDKSSVDATHGQVVVIAHRSNITDSPTQVILTNSTGAVIDFVQGHFSEFTNVALSGAVDGSSSAQPLSTSVASGSITTTKNGDLIYQCAVASDGGAFASVSPGSGFTLADWQDVSPEGMVTQWQVQSTAGAINPTFTKSGSLEAATAAVAYKAATVGTVPTGIRIFKNHDYNSQAETAHTVTITVPTTNGNLFVATQSAGCSGSSVCYDTTAVSDSINGSYTQACKNQGTTSGDSTGSIWYFKNPSASQSMTVTYTLTTNGDPSGHGSTFKFFELVGADTSAPLDTTFGSSGCGSQVGNQTAGGAGGNVATFSSAPGGTNEVMILVGGISFDSATGWTSPSGMLFTGCFYSGILNPTNCDENNPFGTYYNGASTASITPTFSHDTTDSAGVGPYTVVASFFKAPASTLPANQFPRIIGYAYSEEKLNTYFDIANEPVCLFSFRTASYGYW